MFDLSWSEILVIGAAAIIFIGPKELPGALRTLGQWTGRARALAREFQNSVDDMIREAELDKIKTDIKTEVDKLGAGDLKQTIEKAVDPEGEISAALNAPATAWDTPKPAETAQPAPAAPAAPAAAETKPSTTPSTSSTPATHDAPHKPAA